MVVNVSAAAVNVHGVLHPHNWLGQKFVKGIRHGPGPVSKDQGLPGYVTDNTLLHSCSLPEFPAWHEFGVLGHC